MEELYWVYPRTMYAPYTPCESPGYRTLSMEDMENFVGKRIIITEKLDGTNTTLYNGNVYTRSGRRSRHKIHGMVKKYHAWKVWDAPKLSGEDIYAVHSLEYDAVQPDKTFYAFHLRLGRKFMEWDYLVKYTNELEIPIVPLLFDGVCDSVEEVQEKHMEIFESGSRLGPTPEGAVMRIADRIPAMEFSKDMCKVVRRDHVQTDEHWSRNWKPCKIKKE